MTSDSSFKTAPAALACPCSFAIMPSMAFIAMRTNSVTGRRRSGQGDFGISASQAPCAALSKSAPSVTSLALSLARTSASETGRSRA
jgi:hypothetical protein